MSYLSNNGGAGDSNDLGYFATPAALNAAHPTGTAGQFATVGSTNTIWVWDTGTNAWVNTGNSTTLTTTTTVYIDGNRSDTYTEDGTIAKPFKKISSAVTYGNALSAPYTLNLAPGAYTDASVATISQSVIINGGGSSYTIGSGGGTLTISGLFSLRDLSVIGNFVQSNTSQAVQSSTLNFYVYGNVTFNGYCNCVLSSCLGTGAGNGLVTVNATALTIFQNSFVGAPVANYFSRVLNKGIFYFLSGFVYASDAANYAIDSSTAGSQLYTSVCKIFNLGGGGGITVSGNGAVAALNPNAILMTDVNITGTTNGIVCGTSAINLFGYTLTYGYGTTNTTGLATFSAPSTSYFGTIQSRKVPRVTYITSSATPAINTDLCDVVSITALATAITSMTTSLSGAPNNFDKLTIIILDNGTAQTIAWGTSFVQKGVPLPVTTVLGKRLSVYLVWDSVATKWCCVGVSQEY